MSSENLESVLDRDETYVEPRPEPKVFIVAVYLVDRAYGGPEEGGWWYDCGELVRVMRVFKNEQGAIVYCRVLNDYLDRFLNKGRRPVSSVLSEGQYEARIEDDLPRKFFPSQRPHYE